MGQLAFRIVLIVAVCVAGYHYARRRAKDAKVSAESATQPARYVDEKRAKAIRQAALFEETRGTMGAPQCPRCGAEMALELVRRGKEAGSRFWGCTEYPNCRGTREA
jgi:ssDNA-binding Zn-finger/Zn-ribbon topoisomerase 1